MSDHSINAFEVLDGNHSNLLSVEFKTAAATMIGLGWILSSENVHEVIRLTKWCPILLSIIVVAVLCVYSYWVRYTYKISKSIVSEFKVSDGLSKAAIRARAMTVPFVVSFLIVQFTLTILVISFSWIIHFSD